MAGTGQPIQLVIAKRLRSPSIRQTGPITDGIIDIVGPVDLAAGGRELMANCGLPIGGIVGGAQFTIRRRTHMVTSRVSGKPASFPREEAC